MIAHAIARVPDMPIYPVSRARLLVSYVTEKIS